MKAIILDRYSKKDRMRLGDMPEPKLGDNEVLVSACSGRESAGRQDQSGEFKLILPYRFPLVLGHDVAGGCGPRREAGEEIQARRRGLLPAG